MTDQTGPTAGPPTPPERSGGAGPASPLTPPAAAMPPSPQPPPAAATPPPPPAGYGQALPPTPGGAPPARSGGTGRRILRIVGTIVVVSLIGIGWKAYQNHRVTATAPEKGQCIQVQNASSKNPSVKKVDCSDSAAEYAVLDKVAGGSDHACDAVAGTEAVFLSTRGSTKLYALCLKHK